MLFRRTPRRRGQSLVEFALIAPLLFALMFILVELGIVFSVYIGLTNSAREAARAGSVYQYPTPKDFEGKPVATSRATVDAERAKVMDQALVDTRNPLFGITSATTLEPASNACATGAPIRYCYPVTPKDAFRYGDKVIVTLAYRHNLFFNLLGPTSITIKAQSEMRLEPGGL